MLVPANYEVDRPSVLRDRIRRDLVKTLLSVSVDQKNVVSSGLEERDVADIHFDMHVRIIREPALQIPEDDPFQILFLEITLLAVQRTNLGMIPSSSVNIDHVRRG